MQNDIKTVIFVTAFDQYSLQALKSGALDYILKPVEIEELRLAVHKATQKIISHPQYETSHRSKIRVKDGEAVFYLLKEDIVYVEAAESFTWVYMKDKKSHFISKNIGEFEEELKEDSFFRIHRQYLINLQHLVKYIKGRGGWVEMIHGTMIEVSVRRKNQFLAIYEI